MVIVPPTPTALLGVPNGGAYEGDDEECEHRANCNDDAVAEPVAGRVGGSGLGAVGRLG
jgi:hypothetical protein